MTLIGSETRLWVTPHTTATLALVSQRTGIAIGAGCAIRQWLTRSRTTASPITQLTYLYSTIPANWAGAL